MQAFLWLGEWPGSGICIPLSSLLFFMACCGVVWPICEMRLVTTLIWVYNVRTVVYFSLFGVKVKIHPSIWVSLALMAYLLCGIEYGILGMALFVIAGFFCIFAHEMGHALAGRWLGACHPVVDMAWLGGSCSNHVCNMSRTKLVITALSGPLASMALALPVLLWMTFAYGDADGAALRLLAMVCGLVPASVLEFCPPNIVLFCTYMVQVAVWWSVLNLLPIFPLDGGVVVHQFVASPRKMHMFSIISGAVLALVFLCIGLYAMFFILLFLIFINYQGLKHSPY